MEYTVQHSQMKDSSGKCGRLSAFVFCFLLLFGVLRFIVIADYVTIHSDERHYAIDGLWVKAEVPVSFVVRDLLYNHLHPHPLYDPKTGYLVYHGKINYGYLGKGDLGSYPRAGHSCLYMLFLGVIYSLLPTSCLLQGDLYVHVARAVNICFDTAACFLLFDILRQLFSNRMACALLMLLVTMPYVLVNGGLAYLDSFGNFWSVAGIWYYIFRIRTRQKIYDWIVLGILIAFSVLSKQSNLTILPLFASLMILFPVNISPKTLLQSVLSATAFGLIVLCIVSNPFSYKNEFHQANKQILHATQPATNSISLIYEKALNNLTLPLRPKENYHFGVLRHKGIPYVKNLLMVRLYEILTPLAAASIYFSCIILVVRRKYRAWPLIISMLIFIAIIPLGTVLRRLYIFIPHATIIVALGVMEMGCLSNNLWRQVRTASPTTKN